ncbi:ribonuclease T2 family protein [Gluconacetobacter sacchari]|uniref:Ribonuclease I n=2 Tax=Gluconacetobacter sacchari TaxID=92759 RepID=A0A7W4IFC8_9PROT|nr:ribonuclease I [Gluconacetobacter sacchari]MBB2161749.1 ribonuclease I [Gluconacetobacter sacchari]GBQ29556.1 ribonuclease I [Gluconacetobacter sacchari DSM 12717]
MTLAHRAASRARLAFGALILAAGMAACAPTAVSPPAPMAGSVVNPPAHGDFGHYTLALTWQPGFCASGPGCRPDQPKTPLIGLHGLWASRPQPLIAQGVPPQRWWGAGCDIYPGQDDKAPVTVTSETKQGLDQSVAHLSHSLVDHEYHKHVQCFGIPAETFFHTALDLRARVAGSDFGTTLRAWQGRVVSKDAVMRAFRATFHSETERALQLRCEHDHAGHDVLTQLWFTIKREHVGDFPRASAFIRAPEDQDDCPATFLVPAW